jgi:hypothetical protein
MSLPDFRDLLAVFAAHDIDWLSSRAAPSPKMAVHSCKPPASMRLRRCHADADHGVVAHAEEAHHLDERGRRAWRNHGRVLELGL